VVQVLQLLVLLEALLAPEVLLLVEVQVVYWDHLQVHLVEVEEVVVKHLKKVVEAILV
jgi:hypothetical protein